MNETDIEIAGTGVNIREHFALLVNGMNDAIICFNPTDTIAYANPAAAALFGYDTDEIVDLNVPNVIFSRDPDTSIQTPVELVCTLQPETHKKTLTLYGRKKDGTEFPLEMSLAAISIDGQEFLAGIVRDITERRNTEKTLRRNEKAYKTLVDSLPAPVLLINSDLDIVYYNNQARKLLGAGAERRMQKSFAEYTAPADRARAEADIKRILAKETVSDCSYAIVQDGNAPFNATLDLSYVLGNKGAPVGVLAVIRKSDSKTNEDEAAAKEAERLEKALVNTSFAVSSVVKMQDPFVGDHQERVTKLACAIAEEMGLPADKIRGLRIAGNLHDVGKLMIPLQILSKPGKLTDEEFQVVKNHPRSSYDQVRGIEFPWPVANAIFQHHERLDGSGYPHGIKDKEIIVEARILAVADVIEAMASRRPYRAGLGIDKALEEITQNSGTRYDPDVVDACVNLFKEKKFNFF